jgi:hypothetical protein
VDVRRVVGADVEESDHAVRPGGVGRGEVGPEGRGGMDDRFAGGDGIAPPRRIGPIARNGGGDEAAGNLGGRL